jgi:hypothetical protein
MRSGHVPDIALLRRSLSRTCLIAGNCTEMTTIVKNAYSVIQAGMRRVSAEVARLAYVASPDCVASAPEPRKRVSDKYVQNCKPKSLVPGSTCSM